jgi:hypothetical protein
MSKNQIIGAIGIPSLEVFGTAAVSNEKIITAIEKSSQIPTEVKPAINDVVNNFEDGLISNLQALKDVEWPKPLIEFIPDIFEAIKHLF